MTDSVLSHNGAPISLTDYVPPDAPNADEWQFKPYTLDDARADAQQIGMGLSTDFDAFDRRDFRLRAGKLYLVAARQGEGKTAMLLELLMRRAGKLVASQGPAVFVTYEETLLAIYTRLLLRQIGAVATCANETPPTIPMTFVESWLLGQTPSSSPEAMAWTHALAKAAGIIDALMVNGHLALVDGDGSKGRVSELIVWLRATSAALGRAPTLVVLDYAQKIRPLESHATLSRQQQLQQVSDYLRRYAKGEAFDGIPAGDPVPVIVGAQVNRDAAGERVSRDPAGENGEAKKQPELQNIRECDDFANDAAGIITLVRSPDGATMYAKIVKNRDGKSGGDPLPLHYHGHTRHIWEGAIRSTVPPVWGGGL